ncbi:hypothetical protein BN1723_004862 [Verticillium longisporum]|uniref:Uncharacterized protein n=1 Tax=Verticillium longisporum TaxID=100787 RepID=A0A0G4N2C2_VERLO|nr:hypothetical protein BN1723_004862 [Verticillium longisporum]
MKCIALLSLLSLPLTVVDASRARPHHAQPETRQSLNHPGLLHTADDFKRIKGLVDSKKEPFATGWAKLVARANVKAVPHAQDVICRGDSDCTQNYASFYRDVHTAYANAIYWKITGTTANADTAAAILDAWSSKNPEIQGSADRYLAAGIYGYQYANVAEILRDYNGWKGLSAAISFLRNRFYPMNHRFLVEHNDAKIDNYWANWDLCTLCSMHAIGVLSDNKTMIKEAIDYFKNGAGNGAIKNAIWTIHTEEGSGKQLGQNQESGRDQGHTMFNQNLLGVLAQQSYNQGEDLFALLDNRILAGAEYATKYNTFHDVPFATFKNSHGTYTTISSQDRGNIRPIGELLVAHYESVRGLNASWTREYRDMVVKNGSGAEGGGGDYGPNSGGYDQLGFGTILFRRE